MNFSFLKEKGNKYLVFILLGILVLVLFVPTDSTKEESYTRGEVIEDQELEARLKKVLSAMEGVGAVEVMITTQTEEGTLFGEEASQQVCGVVVVAEGAGNASVDTRITEAVKALFSIDVHKISIVKMRPVEEN